MYRVLTLLGAAFIPVWQFVFPVDAWDPLWLRFSFMGMMLLSFILSYRVKDRNQFIADSGAIHIVSISSWTLALMYGNNFSMTFVLSYLVTFLLTSMLVLKPRPLLIHGAAQLAGAIVLYLLHPAPLTAPGFFFPWLILSLTAPISFHWYRLLNEEILVKEKNELIALRQQELERSRQQLHQFSACLVSLAHDRAFTEGDRDLALYSICEAACRYIPVDRASVWEWLPEDESMRAYCTVEQGGVKKAGGQVMVATDHPAFFEQLKSMRSNVTARTDHLSEMQIFLEGRYTGRAVSIIQAPFRTQGRLAGMLTLEMATVPKDWSEQEVGFAHSLADMCVLALEWAQRRETERMLRERNFELDSFVYRVSHDLRAPLNSIQGLVDIMRQTDDPETLPDFLDMIDRSAVKLDNFVQNLMDFSRNERAAISSQEIHFPALVKEVLDSMAHLEGFHQIKTEVEVDQDAGFVSDPSRVRMLLGQLVSNSIKYRDPSKPDSWIKVGVKCSGGAAVLNVEDNGTGIAAEYQEKVFDMFYRASSEAFGSGLGLYIARNIVTRLGGEISVASAVGKGSRFEVRLPVLG